MVLPSIVFPGLDVSETIYIQLLQTGFCIVFYLIFSTLVKKFYYKENYALTKNFIQIGIVEVLNVGVAFSQYLLVFFVATGLTILLLLAFIFPLIVLYNVVYRWPPLKSIERKKQVLSSYFGAYLPALMLSVVFSMLIMNEIGIKTVLLFQL